MICPKGFDPLMTTWGFNHFGMLIIGGFYCLVMMEYFMTMLCVYLYSI